MKKRKKNYDSFHTRGGGVFTYVHRYCRRRSRFLQLQSRQKEACYRGPFVRKQTVSEPTVIVHPSQKGLRVAQDFGECAHTRRVCKETPLALQRSAERLI
jgi:hypothetical protein